MLDGQAQPTGSAGPGSPVEEGGTTATASAGNSRPKLADLGPNPSMHDSDDDKSEGMLLFEANKIVTEEGTQGEPPQGTHKTDILSTEVMVFCIVVAQDFI